MDRKIDYGLCIDVLGVELCLGPAGYSCRPAKAKAEKCEHTTREALRTGSYTSTCVRECVGRSLLMPGRLYAGEAQKLAGRLSWTTQFLFHELGRAMIRPIFDRKCSPDGSLGRELHVALRWWLHVLELDICKEHAWNAPQSSVAHLWVDARGVPPRLAAVLCIDGEWM